MLRVQVGEGSWGGPQGILRECHPSGSRHQQRMRAIQEGGGGGREDLELVLGLEADGHGSLEGEVVLSQAGHADSGGGLVLGVVPNAGLQAGCVHHVPAADLRGTSSGSSSEFNRLEPRRATGSSRSIDVTKESGFSGFHSGR